jgi:ATP-dependent Clp protease, protease subunit
MNWKKRTTIRGEGESDASPSFILERQDKENSIQSMGNRLYFYSDVNKDSIYSLNRSIDEMTKHLKTVQIIYELDTPPPLHLHISTDGGDIFAALCSVDKIANNSIPIYTYCEGMVASAGTLLSIAGKKRFITKNSCMLVHQLSTSVLGTYTELHQETKNLDLTMDILKKIYLQYTKFTTDNLEELLKQDIYLEAENCIKFGLVDEII